VVDEVDDVVTPPDRPPIAKNPLHQGLVNALHNHAIGLSHVRRTVIDIRDRFVEATMQPVKAELDRLGREFRHESDTAAAVAREAEALARGK
jgi:hypothetical protein